jgi:hypothetical protein
MDIMNAERRKKLIVALDKAREVIEALRQLADEETEAFENMPESLQQGEKGQAIEAAAEALGSAADDIENAVESAEAHGA